MPTKIEINGEKLSVESGPDTPLLWVIRDELRLTGTKFGCGIAQCGACTVHVDGVATRSCVTPLAAIGEASITTIEGTSGSKTSALQNAWQIMDVPQCGYCQSGQIMSALELIRNNPDPSDEDIDTAMNGNVCRCVTYGRIRKAIKEAAKTVRVSQDG